MSQSAFEILAAGGPYDSVLQERRRQDAKWGVQNHALHAWLGILMEEVGELAQAANESLFDNGPIARKKGGLLMVRKEAIQVAAVAVALIEARDRQREKDLFDLSMKGGA